MFRGGNEFLKRCGRHKRLLFHIVDKMGLVIVSVRDDIIQTVPVQKFKRMALHFHHLGIRLKGQSKMLLEQLL